MLEFFDFLGRYWLLSLPVVVLVFGHSIAALRKSRLTAIAAVLSYFTAPILLWLMIRETIGPGALALAGIVLWAGYNSSKANGRAEWQEHRATEAHEQLADAEARVAELRVEVESLERAVRDGYFAREQYRRFVRGHGKRPTDFGDDDSVPQAAAVMR